MFGDASDPNDVSERLLAAAFKFEHERGVALDDHDHALIAWAGFDQVPIVDIVSQLLASIETVLRPAGVKCTGYWALGKLYSDELLPFFRQALAVEINDDREAVYQLLIALDNLNEPVFGADRSGSYSSSETDLNLRDAHNYLSLVSDQNSEAN